MKTIVAAFTERTHLSILMLALALGALVATLCSPFFAFAGEMGDPSYGGYYTVYSQLPPPPPAPGNPYGTFTGTGATTCVTEATAGLGQNCFDTSDEEAGQLLQNYIQLLIQIHGSASEGGSYILYDDEGRVVSVACFNGDSITVTYYTQPPAEATYTPPPYSEASYLPPYSEASYAPSSCGNASATLTAAPNRLKSGTATPVTFSISANNASSCTLTGPDITPQTFTGQSCSIAATTYTTPNPGLTLFHQAVYTLDCDGHKTQAVLNVTPTFQEF